MTVAAACLFAGLPVQAASDPASIDAPVRNASLPQPTPQDAPALPAPAPAPPVAAPPAPAPPLPADPRLGTAQVAAEIDRLRHSMAAEVPRLVPLTPDSQLHWVTLARAQIAATQTEILRPQLIVVVDRSPAVQQLAILVARPDAAWEVLGAVHVSTGQAGRYDHYVTPTGAFRHTDAILDYRAQGTYNENHIRGLGLKGMRVWDFGWEWARKGWSPGVGKSQETLIRMEMHATDPAVLEQRIGHPASQGCLRIPAAMNHFLDNHGVLDADYERVAVTDIRYRALLPPHRTPSILAGDILVVIDSSDKPGTPPDQRIERRPAVGAFASKNG